MPAPTNSSRMPTQASVGAGSASLACQQMGSDDARSPVTASIAISRAHACSPAASGTSAVVFPTGNARCRRPSSDCCQPASSAVRDPSTSTSQLTPGWWVQTSWRISRAKRRRGSQCGVPAELQPPNPPWPQQKVSAEATSASWNTVGPSVGAGIAGRGRVCVPVVNGIFVVIVGPEAVSRSPSTIATYGVFGESGLTGRKTEVSPPCAVGGLVSKSLRASGTDTPSAVSRWAFSPGLDEVPGNCPGAPVVAFVSTITVSSSTAVGVRTVAASRCLKAVALGWGGPPEQALASCGAKPRGTCAARTKAGRTKASVDNEERMGGAHAPLVPEENPRHSSGLCRLCQSNGALLAQRRAERHRAMRAAVRTG